MEQIIYYMNMVTACTFVAGGIVIAALLYLLKVRKIAAREENIDTSRFNREDTISYVPFKDMLLKDNLDSDGIIAITDSLFVAGIAVKGFPYGTASLDERIDVEVGSVAFFDVVEEPTSFRKSVKTTDLSSNIGEYEQAMKKIATELMELEAEYNAVLVAYEDYVDDPELSIQYEEQANRLARTIASKNHMIDECRTLVKYMEFMSSDAQKDASASSNKSSQIMFSYRHNPDLYSVELTKEEIYIKAQEALRAKALSYADALAQCHFRAKRLSCRELIELIRKHNFPLTGESVLIDDYLDSSYTSLFVSSDSLVEAQKEKIGEEQYNALIAEYERMIEEALEQQGKDLERRADLLKEASYEQAMYELERGE